MAAPTDYLTGSKEGPKYEQNVVNQFVQWLLDLGYKPEQIQTFPQYRIRRDPRSEKRPRMVDVALFRDEGRSDENLLLIAECKSERTHKHGLDQLYQYLVACGAAVGVWFNGRDMAFLVNVYNIGELLPRVKEGRHLADNFGHYLLLARSRLCNDDKSFSVRKVAERVGIEPSYLSKIERDVVPPPSTPILLRLAEDLGIDEGEVLLKAGRLPTEFAQSIVLYPDILLPLLKKVREAPKDAVADILQNALNLIRRAVKDGEW